MKINYLKSHQLFFIFVLFSCFGLFSCQESSKADTKPVNTTEKIETQTEKKIIELYFEISTIEDDINGNESTIMAIINGEKKKITKSTNCNEVNATRYESMKVPTAAMWACTCWWADAGENFYAIKNNNTVEFYGKEIYEEMEEEYDKWELLKTIN